MTFGPDAAFRADLDSEYPFYVIAVKHEGGGTAKAFEGYSRGLGRGRHGYEFTADYRNYPQDEMELLIFAGEDYQDTRYKINVTYTTVACKE